MEWLEAAVAFAVFMMVMSTIVSVLVETVHRLLAARAKGLEALVQGLYDGYLKTRVRAIATGAVRTAQQFQADITAASFQPPPGWGKGPLHWLLQSQRQTSLTTLEFIERFAATTEGQALANWAHNQTQSSLQPLLEDLASKYEDWGASASEYFQRRARLFSVLIAIGLAVALHVDAVRVFRTFLENKSVRQAAIAAGDEVADELQRQLEAIEGVAAPATDPAAPQDSAALKKLLEEQNAVITAQVEKLQTWGVPMGWEPGMFELSAWVKPGEDPWLAIPRELLLMLLAGLLIGLGGPFWYDTYRKLGSLTGITRGLLTTVQSAKEEPAATAAAPGNDVPTRILEVFQTAIDAQPATFAAQQPPAMTPPAP